MKTDRLETAMLSRLWYTCMHFFSSGKLHCPLAICKRNLAKKELCIQKNNKQVTNKQNRITNAKAKYRKGVIIWRRHFKTISWYFETVKGKLYLKKHAIQIKRATELFVLSSTLHWRLVGLFCYLYGIFYSDNRVNLETFVSHVCVKFHFFTSFITHNE